LHAKIQLIIKKFGILEKNCHLCITKTDYFLKNMEKESEFRCLLASYGIPNDVQILKVLRGEGAPVVLYGASEDVADPIAKTLLKNGIKVSMILYDDETPVLTNSSLYLKDVEKVHTKDIDKRVQGYHLVIGFVKGYKLFNELIAKLKYVYTVSYLSEIFDMETITHDFIFDHFYYLQDFYDRLGDERSKESLIAYLKSKIWQDMKFLPPVFDRDMYFPKGVFELTHHESFFDCGAYVGDTIAAFLKATGGAYRRIWALEPDNANYQKLTQYIKGEKLSKIEAISKGVYSNSGTMPFQEAGTMLSKLSEKAEHTIEVDTIDHIAAGKKITFIKMDVEGAELLALMGAEQTIRKYKPILAISIYHKKNDLLDIPAYLKKIVPKYTFYFRTHKKLAIDSVLYAVVKKRRRKMLNHKENKENSQKTQCSV